MTSVLRVMLILAAGVAGVFAADVGGYWNLELKPNFSGQDETLVCTVKQGGAAVTLTCNGAEISGLVDGQQMTFTVITGAQREQTATFTGTLTEPGTGVTGTWHLVGPDVDAIGQFTMSKTNEKAVPRPF